MNSSDKSEDLSKLLKQRDAELALITSVQNGIATKMDMSSIYELAGDQLREVFDAQVVGVYTLDLEHKMEHFEYLYEDGKRIYPDPRPYDKVREKLIESSTFILINENLDKEVEKITGVPAKAVPGTILPKSILFVPMIFGNEVKGYVSLQNLDKEQAFSDSDVSLLTTLANSLGTALENARLLNETELRNAELAVINSVQEGLVAEMDRQGIYDLVGEKIKNMFNVKSVTIVSFDYETNQEYFEYNFESDTRIYPEPRKIDAFRQKLIDDKELILFNTDLKEKVAAILGVEPKAIPGTELPKSALFVPLILGDTVKGYVSLQNIEIENAFINSDVRLLSTLANSMSVALENARLFSETEQRNAELAVINSVQQGLVAEMNMQGIYDLVGERIRDLFDSQVTAIGIFDHENKKESFHFLFENGKRLYADSRPIDKIRQRLIKTNKLIDIRENAGDAYTTITGEAPKAVPGTEFPKSMLFVPLSIGDTVRGYVSLQNLDRDHAFDDSDVRLLSTLANSMSVALENARLFNETEQRNAELAVINSVQEGLVAEMDMQGIYDLVGERIRELFDAQVTAIATFSLDSNTEKFEYLFEDGGRLYPKERPYDKVREKIITERSVLLLNENAALAMSKILGHLHKPVPGTRAAKSALFVPLMVSDSVRGYVTLQNLDKENAFNESDVRLLSTLANSMSVALENARLFNETEQRNAELAVINSVQQGLVAEMDMQGIYDLVGERIRDLFDAQVTGIYSFDHETNLEIFRYLFEDGERLYPEPRPLNHIREWIINYKKLLLVNENADETIFNITGKEHVAVPGTRLPKSLVFVPLIVGDEVKGCVSLQNLDRENAFSESDVRLLSTLANSMSVALENARLFNETEQRNAELAVINSVQEGLVREMDMSAIYSLVGNRMCEVLNTQTMIIRTFDHKKGIENWEFAIENGELINVEPRPFIWANTHLIKSKEPILINKDYIQTAKGYGDTESGISKGLAPKSAIFVPMIVGDTVIGSISLQNVEKENAFSESDLRLVTTLTNSMSVALENARLFNETTRLLAETERRAAELQTVNNISRAMVSQLEFDALIKLVGEQMLDTFKADVVYLALHDRKTDMLNFPYIHGEVSGSRKFGNGITESIITSKKPLLINQNLDKAYDELQAERKGIQVASYLGVPIIAGKNSFGVISVQSKEQENRFDENDQRLLTTIASNVGIAIQNAEAYQKLQAALNDLRAAQEQLVQQEKLASLGQLTAGIAHEIKNPLNFVNNFSDLSLEMIQEVREELSEINVSSEDIDDLLSNIEANLRKIFQHGTRADGIVKSMLQHSRGGSGVMEPVELNPLIKEYVNLAFHGMRASKNPINVDIDVQLDETVGKYPLIVEDFSRVILNLCNNAFDAMRDKLNNTESSYKAKLKVSTEQSDGKIVIKVEDNGPGIPDQIKANVLQPFFTTKKGTEGTGLGLSITNDIVKAHGGELDLKSTEHEGTSFIIQLLNLK
ncbi:MAG: GAF domain-containing protein [Balneolaceae bacterium]